MADVVRFTELLFANQSLDELLASANRDELSLQEDLWKRLAEAAECMRRNERTRAIELLVAVVSNQASPTRVLLWSWAALRCLGVQPNCEEADAIKGAVIQVPIGKGTDVLAVYADGTARYINHSGKIIVWDLPDTHIGKLIRTVLAESSSLVANKTTVTADDARDDVVRVTVLTLKGNRSVGIGMQSIRSSTIDRVLRTGAVLMSDLIARTEAMNRLVSPPGASSQRDT